jgi:hypothetical protein
MRALSMQFQVLLVNCSEPKTWTHELRTSLKYG